MPVEPLVGRSAISWPVQTFGSSTGTREVRATDSNFRTSVNRTASAIEVFRPTEIHDGDPGWPIINADTGPYAWRGANTFPIGVGGPTVAHPLRYQRFPWSELETEMDRYNFSKIDAEFEAAERCRGLVWLAVYNMRGADRNSGMWVPKYLAVHEYGTNVNGTWLPNFDHPFFKERFARLLRAIAERYGRHPRFYAMDMRAWGPYNENNTWRGARNNLPPYSVSSESKLFYIEAYRTNFPRQQLFIMIDDMFSVNYILNLPASLQTIPIGLRADSWGTEYNDSYLAKFARAYPQSVSLLTNRWKIAPVAGEPYGRTGTHPTLFRRQILQCHVALMGNGNLGATSNWSTADVADFCRAYASVGYRYVLNSVVLSTRVSKTGRFTFTSAWVNRGTSPTYRGWQVEWRLYDSGGRLVWRAPSSTDLRQVLPSNPPVQFTDTYSVPVDPGQYELRLAVVDPTNTLEPMCLAIRGRALDGSYSLDADGRVQLTVVP